MQVADLTFLRVICLKYPQLKVLATVLSSANQVMIVCISHLKFQ